MTGVQTCALRSAIPCLILLSELVQMTPPHLPFQETHHTNHSTYTLQTVNYDDHDDHDDHTPLNAPTPSYGAANFPHTPTRPSSRKVIFNSMLKMACIFAVSSLVLGGVLWLALPTLEEQVVAIVSSHLFLTYYNYQGGPSKTTNTQIIRGIERA